MDTTDKYIGQFLDNRYEILEKIGSGGMAVVYKARCHRLNRLVAVKILKDELSGDADFRRRFRTESQAVAMLSHPNIVAVYDVSRSGNIEYIVMELIEGITLKQYINRKGLLNWKEALHFATQVGKALSHAHSRGIIHRDIKPHNIMILKDGSVKVADFGIARLQSTQNTLTQEALGSVHYISPEQAKGSHVDARSDIYSLGVVMYEMLTSHLPFEGDSAVSIAIQHISAIPLMPREINPDIPPGLESITMHAMEPDLNLRYASADELLADLEEFRKNPAINFSYFSGDNPARYSSDQATREVPSSAIAKVESSLPKPVRTPARSVDTGREDKRRNGKRATKTSTLVAILVIIAFLIGVFVFMWINFLGPMMSPKEVTVEVPKFIGMKYDDIVNNTQYTQTYNFTKTEDYSDDYDAGVVMDQNPTQRTMKLPSNGHIDVALKVSKGKAETKMPNLVNTDWRKAVIQLQNMGLNLDVKPSGQADPNVTKDYVISTQPTADEALVKGGTVFIIYSTGPQINTTKVPDVQNIPISLAQSRLESYKLKWDVKYQDDPNVPKNYVIFQSFEPNAEVQENTVVVLTVSNGSGASSPPPASTSGATSSPSSTPSESSSSPTTAP